MREREVAHFASSPTSSTIEVGRRHSRQSIESNCRKIGANQAHQKRQWTLDWSGWDRRNRQSFVDSPPVGTTLPQLYVLLPLHPPSELFEKAFTGLLQWPLGLATCARSRLNLLVLLWTPTSLDPAITSRRGVNDNRLHFFARLLRHRLQYERFHRFRSLECDFARVSPMTTSIWAVLQSRHRL